MRAPWLVLLWLPLSGCVDEPHHFWFGDCERGPPWLGDWTEPGLWARVLAAPANSSIHVSNGSYIDPGVVGVDVLDQRWGAGNWSLARLGWRHEFVHEGRARKHSLVLGGGEERAKISAWFDKPADVDDMERTFRDFAGRVTNASSVQIDAWTERFLREATGYADDPRFGHLDATVPVEASFRRAAFIDDLRPHNPLSARPGSVTFQREGRFIDVVLATRHLSAVDASLPRLVLDADDRVSLEVDIPRPPRPDEARQTSGTLLEPLGIPAPRGFPTEFHNNRMCAALA